ncbi:MAG: hypothetical protein ACI38A_00510, partial [Candidatus Ornithomonoglobus sp.]
DLNTQKTESFSEEPNNSPVGAILKYNRDTITADKIFFDGMYIYGTRIRNTSETKGTIFAARVTFDFDENGIYYYLDDMHEIQNSYTYQFLYKNIRSKNEKGEVSYTPYLYFADSNDNATIKRVNLSTWKQNWNTINHNAYDTNIIEIIKDSDGNAISYIDGFGISDGNSKNSGYMIYNYHNECVKLAEIDESNTAVVKPLSGSMQLDALYGGMIANDFAAENEYTFYYIYSNGEGEQNYIKGITNITDTPYQQKNIFPCDDNNDYKKIRNIALIDGKLYGRIDDGDYTEIPLQEN